MELISSRNNPKIKQVRLLKERKARQASGLAVVEGIFPVGEAVAAAQERRVSVESIFYAPALAEECLRQRPGGFAGFTGGALLCNQRGGLYLDCR